MKQIREIVLSESDLTRLQNDSDTITFHFDHLKSVTLVHEYDRKKWESHHRDSDRGDVVFLDDDDIRRIRYSKKGIHPQPDGATAWVKIHLVHKSRQSNCSNLPRQ